MKIVHIANFYGPNSGGIRTTIHQLGSGYISRGHEFIFVVPGCGLYFEETPTGLRITVPSYRLPFSSGYRIIRNNRSLQKLLTELKPDCIEVSDRFTLSSLGLWARSQNIPAVVFSHETLVGLAAKYIPFPIRRTVNWHNRRLANRFSRVVTTTQFAAKEFHGIGARNLSLVPLGVDLSIFSPSARNFRLRHQLSKGAQHLLVHCGRMSLEKNPAVSIDAVVELVRRGHNVRLVFIGNGPMWRQLRASAKDLPVTFLGYLADRHRLASILASADLFIAPGPIETFCLAALESIASGTRVVASNTSAVGEFLSLEADHPLGAVADNDPIAFADAIENILLEKREPSYPGRCRLHAEKFSWGHTVELMLNLHETEIQFSDPRSVKSFAKYS